MERKNDYFFRKEIPNDQEIPMIFSGIIAQVVIVGSRYKDTEDICDFENWNEMDKGLKENK